MLHKLCLEGGVQLDLYLSEAGVEGYGLWLASRIGRQFLDIILEEGC